MLYIMYYILYYIKDHMHYTILSIIFSFILS